jgi:hypothetical protein
MKTILTAALVALTIGAGAIGTATDASAQRRGGAAAAGIIGGLAAGAIIGGAIANSGPAYAAPPPAYYAPPPAYYEQPCRMVRQQYWDGYGYRVRRVEVCD